MKKCPVCNRTYNDPTLNFCLEDGANLIAQTGNFGQLPSPGFASLPPQFKLKKKRNPVFWVLGILGAVAVIAIAGFIGLIALLAASAGNSNNSKRVANNIINSNNISNNPSNLKTSNNNVNLSSKEGETIDFSRWGERKTTMGETKLVGDEFQVSAAKNNFYYVLVASNKFEDKYLTNNAISKVTTHSVTGASPSLGYGLIVNSDVEPLKSDYAFLIRSDNQTFRVVRHQDKEEETIKNWSTAPQIRTGTQTNQLEVRSNDDKLSFYINGQLAVSVTDENDTDEGLVGLYTSDTAPIGFSDLQITKK